jgi:exopolyphosphatase/guanosine-5'-triphosphate,3'-diphosphate pyrophosphatase
MDRAYEALALCAERLARKGVDTDRLAAVATQACRAADNGAAFVERVRAGTGLSLRIIDPAEEARLSVEGCINLIDPAAEAALVIDVGGGSTEMSWLRRAGDGYETAGWMSAPLGVVTLAERHPEPADSGDDWYEAMVADMGAAITAGGIQHDDIRALFAADRAHLVGTSGAITSLAGIHLKLPRYNRDRVDGLWMTRAEHIRIDSVVPDMDADYAAEQLERVRSTAERTCAMLLSDRHSARTASVMSRTND